MFECTSKEQKAGGGCSRDNPNCGGQTFFGPASIQRQEAPEPTARGFDDLTATRVAFRNDGEQSAENCSVLKLKALGLDGPGDGQAGMEMEFRLDGTIPPGTEFDILRTNRAGLWQRVAGAPFTRVGGAPAGTNDDHTDFDECLKPVGRRIFVVDVPGSPGLDPRGVEFPDDGTVDMASTAVVWKVSFAEWVNARNVSLGIPWTPISKPLFTFWHTILSVAPVGGVWKRVITPSGQHNEIALGSVKTDGPLP